MKNIDLHPDVPHSLRSHSRLKGMSCHPHVANLCARIGDLIFVSHQWLGAAHPDLNFQQLRVLQRAMDQIIGGQALLKSTNASYAYLGHGEYISTNEWRSRSNFLFIWYDYFSCPQLVARNTDQEDIQELQNAVDSIPHYVQARGCVFHSLPLCPCSPERVPFKMTKSVQRILKDRFCKDFSEIIHNHRWYSSDRWLEWNPVQASKYFVVLAPCVKHVDTGDLMSKESWQSRGWCRVERVCREFLCPDSNIAVIESTQHWYLGDCVTVFEV